MKTLEQPSSAEMTVKYFPDADEVAENPPRFIWVPEMDSHACYALKLKHIATGKETLFANIRHNFYRPDVCIAAGEYEWRYALWDKAAKQADSVWSQARKFTLLEGAPEVPALQHEERYGTCSMAHPRLWLNPDEVEALGAKVKADPDYCKWSAFMKHSVTPWASRELIAEPKPYPNNTRTPPLWRQMYIDCQEAIYGIRHQAIAGKVLKDAALVAKAKAWLLHVAAWDVRGTSSRDYNDEAGFRIAGALAWGYDWLYNDLNAEERQFVREALLIRTREVAVHVMDRAKIHLFPYDSHAVRSISSVLIPCSIALLGEEPEAEVWLDYAINFYEAIYPPWGGANGGWAEGPHYWMTAMAYFTEAANFVLKYFKHDLYKRTFFQQTGWFPLYTKAPDTRRACFGDDSTQGDLPCLKVGYNLRQFAGVTGNQYFQWYFEELCRNDPGTEMAFYNYGWWDLRFDDVQYLHDFPQIEAKEPSDMDKMRFFQDVGWVAIQKDMHDPEKHIQFITKCSPYGSISHSHGDQGAFLLSAFGEDLAFQGGYYSGFGTAIHQKWRRQTISKNAILIDGKGQYADGNKAECLKAAGRILEVAEREGALFISMDPSAAYKAHVPYLKNYRRDIHFVHDAFVVVVDEVELTQEGSVQFLLHTYKACELGRQVFRYEGERAGLAGEFVFCSSGEVSLENRPAFADVSDEELNGLVRHSFLVGSTPKATKHSIVTLLTPYRKGNGKRVFNFIDDQGFATNMYFQDETGETYTVKVPKHF